MSPWLRTARFVVHLFLGYIVIGLAWISFAHGDIWPTWVRIGSATALLAWSVDLWRLVSDWRRNRAKEHSPTPVQVQEADAGS